jgi:iron complex outermembrane receptor protein
VFGGEGRFNTSAAYRAWQAAEVFADGDHPYETYSAFIQDEWQVTPTLALTAGLRHDQHSEVGGATSPRAAAVYHPSDRTTLKLLYGKAFRAPTVWELNFDEFEGTGLPAPDLQPERITTTEVVWEQRLFEAVSVTASGFHYSMRDLIDFVLVGDPDDDAWQYGNTARVKAFGSEFQVTAALGGGASGHISYTYQNAKDADLESTLSNTPSHMVKLAFGAPLGDYLTLGANVLYETGRLTVREERTDDFFLTDLTVSTRPVLDGWSLSASVKNAFNTEYRTPGGWEHVQDGILQPSRRLFVALRFGG